MGSRYVFIIQLVAFIMCRAMRIKQRLLWRKAHFMDVLPGRWRHVQMRKARKDSEHDTTKGVRAALEEFNQSFKPED